MSAANNGTIVGTIVSDIMSRKPNDGLEVVSFRVSPVDAREDDSPIPMTAYNGAGQRILERCNKGDTLSFTYRLRYNTWMTPEGEPRGRMEIVVTSDTMIRLGQISVAKRAEVAAGTKKEEVVTAQAELVLEEIPF